MHLYKLDVYTHMWMHKVIFSLFREGPKASLGERERGPGAL